MQQRKDYEDMLTHRRLGRQKIRRWHKQKKKQTLAKGQRQRQTGGGLGGYVCKTSAQVEEYIGSDEDDPYESTGKFRHPYYRKDIDGKETGKMNMKMKKEGL
jgi:hypothetical protein